MVPLQQLPDELTKYIAQHKLVRADILAAEQPATLQQAIAQAAGLTLRSFAELAGQPSSREVLWNTVREAAAAPGTPATNEAGRSLLRQVLDDRYHGTVSATAAAAQVSVATVHHLFERVPAAALAFIGEAVAEQHWTAQQLADWLRPRRHAPLPVSPAPVVAAAPRPLPKATPAAPGWLARPAHLLLVLMTVVAVAEFGYILKLRRNGAADSDTTPGVVTAATSYPATSNAAEPGVPKSGSFQPIKAKSTESKLYQLLLAPANEAIPADPASNWIGFDRITFADNDAKLNSEALWQLANVASILKRFPEARLKIGGYSGNSGKPLNDLLLSKRRAEAAKKALENFGVAADHLTAVGYGPLDSSAPHTAKAGQALSYRVSLQVTQK
jgi:outer membrane protein OmpA-like peptidoglycan-associated protein